MPKKKPRIDHVRPEIPEVPGTTYYPPKIDPIEPAEKPQAESKNLFDKVGRAIVKQLIPLIKENLDIDASLSLADRTVQISVYLFGQRLLDRVIKIKI